MTLINYVITIEQANKHTLKYKVTVHVDEHSLTKARRISQKFAVSQLRQRAHVRLEPFCRVRLGSLYKLRFHFLVFDHVCTPPSLHFLYIKSSIFLTTYPPLNANVICEGSLIKTFLHNRLGRSA